MRHGKKFNHLGRTASHRKSMLSNMASSLILHKRISTTVAKAKELKRYVEPLITKAKSDTTHSRRVVFSYLQNKESVKSLFSEVAEKTNTRPGGYTRIIKLGTRLGDNAEMCIMELVDFNENLLKEAAPAKKTRRTRRSKKKGDEAPNPQASSGKATKEESKADASEENNEVKADAEKDDHVKADAAEGNEADDSSVDNKDDDSKEEK